MKLEHRSLSRLALPLKALLERFAFAALIVASIALLLVGKADVRLLDAVSARIGDAMTPVLSAVVQPLDASRRVAAEVGELFALRQENAHLREQNQRLLEWQAVARRLALENASLRQLLNLDAGVVPPTAISARVVADAGGPFVHTVLVNAGASQGVVKGMAAVNERGLVGRVIEVGRQSARVLLLTDFNSRVPVMIEPSRDQAILAGDNSREPRLTFLPLDPRMAIGQRVVTSGRGGVLPPGLAVGIISAIGDQAVAVAPAVDWDRLEYVRLLEYGKVVPPEALAPLQREVFGPPRPPAGPVADALTAEPAPVDAPAGEPPLADGVAAGRP